MQIKETKPKGLNHSFDVVVSTKGIEQKVKEQILKLGQGIRVDGFRPGKAPFAIIEGRCGTQARRDVIEILIKEATKKVIADKKLRPATRPSLNLKAANPGKDLEFSIDIEVIPDIKVKGFSGFKFERFQIKPSDEDIDKALKSIAADKKIDDALAKELGLSDLAELNKTVKEQLGKQMSQASFMHIKRMVLDRLSTDYDFEIPESLAEREFDVLWKTLKEGLAKEAKKPSEKELKDYKNQYRKIAERRVRLGLVLSAIGEEHKISVTEQELAQAVNMRIKSYPDQQKEVLDFYRSNPSAVSALKAPILENKVVEFILEQSKVADKNISSKDFQKEIEKLESQLDAMI